MPWSRSARPRCLENFGERPRFRAGTVTGAESPRRTCSRASRWQPWSSCSQQVRAALLRKRTNENMDLSIHSRSQMHTATPEEIAATAVTFFSAYRVLDVRSDVGPPKVVCLALAVELVLKALLAAEGTRYGHIHSLHGLFEHCRSRRGGNSLLVSPLTRVSSCASSPRLPRARHSFAGDTSMKCQLLNP
jgi:hypothetical protein